MGGINPPWYVLLKPWDNCVFKLDEMYCYLKESSILFTNLVCPFWTIYKEVNMCVCIYLGGWKAGSYYVHCLVFAHLWTKSQLYPPHHPNPPAPAIVPHLLPHIHCVCLLLLFALCLHLYSLLCVWDPPPSTPIHTHTHCVQHCSQGSH